MEYVSVGTDVLKKEYMNAIMDSDSIKPVGGLWCTEHKYEDFFSWIDYMLYTPRVFAYKSLHCRNPFIQNAVLVTLNTGAKICTLRGEEGTHIYKDIYGSSFERMADDYDAVLDAGSAGAPRGPWPSRCGCSPST